MGGGFETALACDIIIAAENALFALPEPRVGLIAGGGGVHRLPRMIPIKKAMGMILTGRRVPAREGFELGFVTEVVPEGQALEAAKRWAGMILECSPKAVRASKQASYRGLDEQKLETAMRTVYPAQQENIESQDYIEGPKGVRGKAQAGLAKQIEGPERWRCTCITCIATPMASRTGATSDRMGGGRAGRQDSPRANRPTASSSGKPRRSMTAPGIPRRGGNTSSTSTPAWN